jgi:putative hemolysin
MDRLPLDIRDAIPALAGNGARAWARRIVESCVGLNEIRAVYRRVQASEDPPFGASLRGFEVDVLATGLERIPPHGPVLLVANHPLGGADALALGAICEQRRPDFFILANEMATSLPRVAARCLPLDIMSDAPLARHMNASTLRQALAHLRAGGCLAAFPSGEVARWRGHAVEEGPWSPHIAALAVKTGATVVPLKFHNRAPAWHPLVGSLHPMLHTALIPRVLLAGRGQPVRATVGSPIPPNHDLLQNPARLRAFTLAIEEALV